MTDGKGHANRTRVVIEFDGARPRINAGTRTESAAREREMVTRIDVAGLSRAEAARLCPRARGHREHSPDAGVWFAGEHHAVGLGLVHAHGAVAHPVVHGAWARAKAPGVRVGGVRESVSAWITSSIRGM